MTNGHAFSRAAIAGNPSDGFGGAVCSVIVPMFSATATINTSDDEDEGLRSLVLATRSRFSADVRAVAVGVTISTNIPRLVGLAGSSAIVIATIRALAEHAGVEMSDMATAEMAHRVERVDLAIAGGWQDQLIQSHGRSGLVECGEPRRVEPIEMPTKPPIPLYLAWSAAAAEASGDAHTGLQCEHSVDDPEMLALAELGRQAARAFAARNVHGLKEAINATFDIRRTLMQIAPAQVEMIDTARELGACANFAGSGGAIVGCSQSPGPRFSTGWSKRGTT